jgi:hypothetical protein
VWPGEENTQADGRTRHLQVSNSELLIRIIFNNLQALRAIKKTIHTQLGGIMIVV